MANHAAAQGHRQRQPAALGDQFGGFARQLIALDTGGLGEQVQRFRIGQQLDL